MERAVVICRGSSISSSDLHFSNTELSGDSDSFDKGTLKESIAHLEQCLIKKALYETGNNQTRAANQLGISERMIRYKIKKYRMK